MILTTSNHVPGKVIETKGIVRAQFTLVQSHLKTLRQKPIFPFLPFIKNVEPHALAEYLYSEIDKQLIQEAETLGANAIHSIRYVWPVLCRTILAFGTAVVVESNE